MAGRSHIVPRAYLCILLLLLLLPLVQSSFHLVDEPPLKGAVMNTPAPEWSWAAWYTDSLQHQMERHLNDQFGFRRSLVRLNNQVEWSLFGEVRARDVVVGRDNWLYEAGYIQTLYGEDYVGSEKLQHWARQAARFQKMLHRYGKLLVIVLAPGKGSIYPEFIPAHLQQPLSDTTNYLEFSHLLRERNVNVIDFNAWFKGLKANTPHPLYPKTGIHWSVYGKYLAVDSLLHYIESKTGKDLPDMLHQGPMAVEMPTAEDRDVERGMNLIFPIPNIEMGYPNVCFDRGGKRLFRSLTIADSYWWGIHGRGIAGRIFRNPEFWYYNEEIYGGPGRGAPSVLDIDPAAAIGDREVIIFMCTDAKLKNFGWRFWDNFAKDKLFEARMAKVAISKTVEEIRKNERWLRKVKNEALERDVSLDSMLISNARYHLWARLPRD